MNIIDKNIITKYLQGKLNDSEVIEFEKAMLEDDFLRDAVEGYKKAGTSPIDLIQIDNKFIIQNKKKTKRLFGIIFSGIAATLIIIATTIMITSRNHNFKELNVITQNINDSIIDIENDSVYVSQYITETSKDPNISNLELGDIPIYTTELRPLISEPTSISENFEPLYTNKNLIIENTIPKKDLNKYYRFMSNSNYFYLDNYKVVDYRFLKRDIKTIIEIPSNRDIRENIDPNYIKETTEYYYVDFLEKALLKLSDKRYSEAIEDFNLILENYPDDQNAIFYKGICYYETNKNFQSLRFFETTLSSNINTFHEDAQWYKSLIYKREKQYEIAHKILEEIVNENGYYGVQAKKELDELYKHYLNE